MIQVVLNEPTQHLCPSNSHSSTRNSPLIETVLQVYYPLTLPEGRGGINLSHLGIEGEQREIERERKRDRETERERKKEREREKERRGERKEPSFSVSGLGILDLLSVNPTRPALAVTNHRNELIVIEFAPLQERREGEMEQGSKGDKNRKNGKNGKNEKNEKNEENEEKLRVKQRGNKGKTRGMEERKKRNQRTKERKPEANGGKGCESESNESDSSDSDVESNESHEKDDGDSDFESSERERERAIEEENDFLPPTFRAFRPLRDTLYPSHLRSFTPSLSSPFSGDFSSDYAFVIVDRVLCENGIGSIDWSPCGR